MGINTKLFTHQEKTCSNKLSCKITRCKKKTVSIKYLIIDLPPREFWTLVMLENFWNPKSEVNLLQTTQYLF